MGVFAITSVENQDGKITLKLSDRMLRLEQPGDHRVQGNPYRPDHGREIQDADAALHHLQPVHRPVLCGGGGAGRPRVERRYHAGNAFEGETSGRNLLAYIAQAAAASPGWIGRGGWR